MSSSQIKRGALLSYISIFLNVAMGLVYTPWLINSIGRDSFGLYTLAMSCITLFSIDFGLGNAVLRFVAKYRAENNENLISKLMGIVSKLYLSIDIIIFLILTSIFFFIPAIYKGLTPTQLEQFKVVYVIASCYCVVSFPFIPLNGVLNAYEEFTWLKGCDIIHKLIIVALMSICLILNYGLYALVTVNAISGLIVILLKLTVIKEKTPVRIDWSCWDNELFKKVINFSVWVTIIILAQRCIFNIAPSVLGIVSTADAIAIIGVAITIEGYVYTFGAAINGMFLPKVSKLVNQNNDFEILKLMVKVGRIQVMIVSLIIIGFVLIGKSFINLWVGPQFSSVYACVILLIIPSILHIPQEVASTLLIVKNKVKHQAIAYTIMAIANVLLIFPFAKLYGAIGVSIAIGFSYLLRTIIINVIYYKVLKVDLAYFFKNSYLKLLPGIALSVLICIPINFIPIADSWISLLLKGTLIVTVFCASQWYISMNKSEKELMTSYIKKI